MDQTHLINQIDHYHFVSEIKELDTILNDNVNITIHQRDLDSLTIEYLKNLLDSGFSSFNKTLKVDDFRKAFDKHFKKHEKFNLESHNLLREDIFNLISNFSKIVSSKSLTVFFSIVSTNMCSRFHTDMYDFRLISSYSGQGTCWLTNDNINFNAFRDLKSNDDIVLRKEDIQQLESNDIAIMRGELSYSNIGGVVHKSPQIENLNQKRIILRVDSKSLLGLN